MTDGWPAERPGPARRAGEQVGFSLSAEQEELTATAVEFTRRELDWNRYRRDDSGEFSPDAWRALRGGISEIQQVILARMLSL
jgi:hypothetical protein